MTHDLSHETKRRPRRRLAQLAIAVITAALAVPAVAAAQPIPADPSSSYPSTGGNDQAFIGSVTALAHKSAPASASTGGNDQAFTGSVTALAHKGAPADTTVALRRDGTKADPFVADVSGSPTTTASDDDFAWGDAGIGAGVALGLIALAGVGIGLRRNGTYTTRSVPTAS
jgi:hypothetical protein